MQIDPFRLGIVPGFPAIAGGVRVTRSTNAITPIALFDLFILNIFITLSSIWLQMYFEERKLSPDSAKDGWLRTVPLLTIFPVTVGDVNKGGGDL